MRTSLRPVPGFPCPCRPRSSWHFLKENATWGCASWVQQSWNRYRVADKSCRQRASALLLSLALSAGLAAAPAQQGSGSIAPAQPTNSLAGKWRALYQGVTIVMVIQSNGQYMQTVQSGATISEQSGAIRLIAPNTVAFTVADWQPRTRPAYHAVGSTGGYTTQEPVVRPSDTMDTYVFDGPDRVVLTDQALHGSLAFTRVP